MTLSQIKAYLYIPRWLSPKNYTKEQDKFLNSRTYNPHFFYTSFPQKLYLRIQSYLQHHQKKDNSPLLQDRLNELDLKLKLFTPLSDFTSSSLNFFQVNFKPQTLQLAQKHASIKVQNQPIAPLNPQETQQQIINYLHQYHIPDWKISLTNQKDFNFRVIPSRKILLISKYPQADFQKLDTILAHEIDGHILRAHNATLQAIKDHRAPFPFYQKTEEGLASFLSDFCSQDQTASLRRHAIKYLAAHLALTHSFRQVYDFLREQGYSAQHSFQLTFRLKRGLADTSLPGLFARDAIYYQGMLDVKNYLDQGGDPLPLFAAKTSLQYIKQVNPHPNTIIPQRLKNYLKS